MVFQWFLKFWWRWSTMVWMYHCTRKCLKSICDKMQIHSINTCRTPIHGNLTYSTAEKRLPNISILHGLQMSNTYCTIGNSKRTIDSWGKNTTMWKGCMMIIKWIISLEGLAEFGLGLQFAAMNIKDNWQWQVRLFYKRASSRLRMVIVTTRKVHYF